jgi:hypothetical protein
MCSDDRCRLCLSPKNRKCYKPSEKWTTSLKTVRYRPLKLRKPIIILLRTTIRIIEWCDVVLTAIYRNWLNLFDIKLISQPIILSWAYLLRPKSSIYSDSSWWQLMLDSCLEPGIMEAQNLRGFDSKSAHFSSNQVDTFAVNSYVKHAFWICLVFQNLTSTNTFW